MANTINNAAPAGSLPENRVERRREARHDIPEAYRKHIKLQVKCGNEFVPAFLANFSRNGLLFECPVPLNKGTRTECVLTISLVLARDISFMIEVMYCYTNNGTSIMGASIDTISDSVWFDAFVEVHDLIILKDNPA